MTRIIWCVALALALIPAVRSAPQSDSLAGSPPFRRLFLDATVVEESANLQRVFHSAVKHPGNPVIRKEHSWEGWGPYLYGTVLKDGDTYRMWYQGVGGDCADVMMAVSKDGLRWTKPDLGVVEYAGSKKNNIVAGKGLCHIPSVIRHPDPASPAQRWLMFGYADGPCVAYSPDGIRWDWNRKPEQRTLFSSSDVVNVFFDPYRSRFTATYKTSNRRHRAVGVAVSDDGLKWKKPVEGAVFGADDLDPDATQIYGMPVFPYQGIYIGLPWIYHARWIKYGKYTRPDVMYEAQEGSPLTVDVQLAWSHDMLSWTRTPERKPFIPLGPKGAFDSGMIYTARAPVQLGDRLYFYYGGFNGLHDKGTPDGAIGLATLRLDGFCSMSAGNREGSFITRREVFNTPRVVINAVCRKGGRIEAEIVDRNNKVVPGFSRSDCVPFTGDSVQHTMTWKTAAFPESLRDRDKKVRFFLKNADLYSYLPVDINTLIDNGSRDY